MSHDDRPGDFSEPMMWPRYTGDPDVHAYPLRRDPRRRGRRPHRGAVRRRGDEPHRRAARVPREIRNQSIAHAPHQPGDEGRTVRSVSGMRCGGHADQEPVPPGVESRRDRAGVRPAARCGGRPHRGRAGTTRSPCPSSGPSRSIGRWAWCTSTPTATPTTTISARSSIMERRSAARSRRGCSTRTAPSRSGSAAGVSDVDVWKVQPRQRDARGLHGRVVRARMAFGHRGSARGRRRRPDLCELRRGRARPRSTRPAPARRRSAASRRSRHSS